MANFTAKKTAITAAITEELGACRSWVVFITIVFEILSHLMVMVAAWESTAYVIPVYLLLHFLIATQVTDLSVRQLLEAPLLWLFPSSRLVSSRPCAARGARLCSWLLRWAMFGILGGGLWWWFLGEIRWRSHLLRRSTPQLPGAAALVADTAVQDLVARRQPHMPCRSRSVRQLPDRAAVVHTQLLQRAGGTLCSACSSALAAVSISISCCGRPSSGSCGWDSPGPGHLLLQAAGRGARHPGSGHNEHRDRGSGLAEKSVLHTYDCWAILPRCHPWYEWDFAIFADGQFHVFCRIRHHFLHIFTSASGPGWSSEALECDIGIGEAWPVHWRFAENHALREGTGSATTAVSSILRISVRYIQSCSSLVIYIFIVFELKISGGGHLLVSRAQAPRCACDAIWSIVVSPKRWKKTSGRTSWVLSLGSHFHGRWNVLFKHVWL